MSWVVRLPDTSAKSSFRDLLSDAPAILTDPATFLKGSDWHWIPLSASTNLGVP